MTYLILVLLFSLTINIFLIWYISKILSKLLFTSDNLGDLYISFRMYENFTSSLYEMDMFYGEPILEELIEKTKLVRTELETFEHIYGLTTDVDLLEEDMIDEYTKEEAPKEN